MPDEKILLAEMNEARRRAEAQLQQPESIAAVFGHQMHEMFDHLSTRLAANYEALEKATTEQVEISRQAIERWRRETREFTALLSDLDRRLPSPA